MATGGSASRVRSCSSSSTALTASTSPHYISLAEAEELHRELGVAIRAFDRARALSQAVAAWAPYPFRDHRTLAETMADEGAQ